MWGAVAGTGAAAGLVFGGLAAARSTETGDDRFRRDGR
jgi:hypothetical protein